MNRRQAFFTHLGLLVTVLGLWTALSRPSVGQAPVEKPSAIGRYQVATSGNYNTITVIDTTNGHCWERISPQDHWRDMGSPIK